MRSLAALLLVPALLQAQEKRTSAFTGVVWRESTQEAVAGAEVLLPKLDLHAVTDSNGIFRLVGLPPGTHELLVRRMGFEQYKSRVGLIAGDTTRQLVYLKPALLTVLDTVNVRARTTGIPEVDERRLMKIGSAIMREELDKKEASKLGDLIGDLPGVVVRRTRAGGAYALNSRGPNTIYGNNKECYVMVYVDDAPVYSGNPGEMLYNLNNVVPKSLEAVEYFSGASQVPAKYNRTGSACGVLLLWTRRR